MLAAFSLPGNAWAETFATVQALSVPDVRGRWTSVETTPAAARVADESRTPLSVGMALEVGDRISTEQARVTIRLADNEHLTVSEGADLTLKERSVIQRLGEVYYQVRGLFRVDYGTVQTAVEGTEFSIDGTEGPVRVAVTDGVVRVSNAGESVRVRRGEEVTVALSAAPSAPVVMTGAARRSVLSKAWSLGRPRLQVGAMAGGGMLSQGAAVEGRGFAAIRLLPGMNLVAETGLGGLGGVEGIRVPASLGMELALGGFSVGGSGQVTLERWRYSCGGRHIAVHLGGTAHVRFTMPLTRRVFVVGTSRLGHDGSAIEASMMTGLGVSL